MADLPTLPTLCDYKKKLECLLSQLLKVKYAEIDLFCVPFLGSCANACGKEVGGCYCDDACKSAGDCCSDYDEFCGSE